MGTAGWASRPLPGPGRLGKSGGLLPVPLSVCLPQPPQPSSRLTPAAADTRLLFPCPSPGLFFDKDQMLSFTSMTAECLQWPQGRTPSYS